MRRKKSKTPRGRRGGHRRAKSSTTMIQATPQVTSSRPEQDGGASALFFTTPSTQDSPTISSGGSAISKASVALPNLRPSLSVLPGFTRLLLSRDAGEPEQGVDPLEPSETEDMHLHVSLPLSLPDVQSLPFFMDRVVHPFILKQPEYVTLTHPFCINCCDPITLLVPEKEFSSAARPVMFSLHALSPNMPVTVDFIREIKPRVLAKKGDDLRTDTAVLTMFRVFNAIWAKYGGFETVDTTPYIHTYQVISTGENLGLIEMIPNVQSFASFSWTDWVKRASRRNIDRMICSAVGAFVGGYVVGVRDRHWDNIMVRGDHTVLHIDFGHVLGERPPIDAPLFAIPPQMRIALRVVKKYDLFVSQCVAAYDVLRQHAEDIIALSRLAFSPAGHSPDDVESYIRSGVSLRTSMSRDKALDQVRAEVLHSPSSWHNLFKQDVHRLGTEWRNFFSRMPSIRGRRS